MTARVRTIPERPNAVPRRLLNARGKSGKIAPHFIKCGKPILGIDVDDIRHCLEDAHVTAKAKKEVRKWQPLRPPIYRLSHFIKSEILDMADCV